MPTTIQTSCMTQPELDDLEEICIENKLDELLLGDVNDLLVDKDLDKCGLPGKVTEKIIKLKTAITKRLSKKDAHSARKERLLAIPVYTPAEPVASRQSCCGTILGTCSKGCEASFKLLVALCVLAFISLSGDAVAISSWLISTAVAVGIVDWVEYALDRGFVIASVCTIIYIVTELYAICKK